MRVQFSHEQFEKFIQENEFNEYKMRDHQGFLNFKKEVEVFHPCFLQFTMDQEGERTYFEFASLYLQHLSLDFKISKHQKGFSIRCESIQNFKNINYNHIKECAKNLTEPQQIGVLTAKKIQNWVNYYEQLYDLVCAKSKEHEAVRTEFLKSIEDLPIRWAHESTERGEILQNGILLNFEILPGYVSLRWGIHYSVNSSVANFIKLSQNNL